MGINDPDAAVREGDPDRLADSGLEEINRQLSC